MILDLIGIGIALLVRGLLCNVLTVISELWLQSILVIVVNIACIAVCLFIIFFFLLYWWSDRKWTNIKRKFRKK